MAIDFNKTYPWSDIETVTIDGQIMVKIPKFYVKYDTILGNYLVASQYVAYTYKESARTNQGLMDYAIEECDRLAMQTFISKTPTSLNLSLVKQELYEANLQLFNSQGINNPDSIDLAPFTVHISLWNYTYKGQMLNSKIEVK